MNNEKRFRRAFRHLQWLRESEASPAPRPVWAFHNPLSAIPFAAWRRGLEDSRWRETHAHVFLTAAGTVLLQDLAPASLGSADRESGSGNSETDRESPAGLGIHDIIPRTATKMVIPSVPPSLHASIRKIVL